MPLLDYPNVKAGDIILVEDKRYRNIHYTVDVSRLNTRNVWGVITRVNRYGDTDGFSGDSYVGYLPKNRYRILSFLFKGDAPARSFLSFSRKIERQ